MQNKKYRNFEIILYPEDNKHIDILYLIKKEFKYAYILHNRDLKEDLTDYKKEHWHVQIFLNNQTTITALGKKLNIENFNLIQIIRDKKKSIRYLVHADNNEKETYNVDDIITNIDISSYFSNLISNETCDIQMILDFLENRKTLISYFEFVKFVRDTNIWSTYRRNQYIINKLIDEHNASIKGEILDIFR